MKKMSLAILIALCTTSVFASTARLEALGESGNGSQWISDNRNVFVNPAHANMYADTITMEWGPSTTGAGKAEGGVFRTAGNFVYGVHLGQESATSNALRAATTGTNTEESNNLDLFIAGDAGVQWGARLSRTASENEAAATTGLDMKDQSAMRLALGVVSGAVEGWAKVGINNEVEFGNGTKFDGKSSIAVGGTYSMNDWSFYGSYGTLEAEFASVTTEITDIKVGAGHTHNLNDRAKMFCNVEYGMQDIKDSEESNYLGVDFALEYMAKSWLTVRGSVGQNLMASTEDNNGKAASDDSGTQVAAGASLVFGDLTIDGMLGDTAGDKLNANDFLSKVSMTYRF